MAQVEIRDKRGFIDKSGEYILNLNSRFYRTGSKEVRG
jgi:hypothetical protein